MALWSSEEDWRKSEQLSNDLIECPAQYLLCCHLKDVPLGKGQDSVAFCEAPGNCLAFRLRKFPPHPPRLHFPSQRLPAWVKLISLLLLMKAMGLPSVCTWTTYLPLQSSPKNMFWKNKHLGLPKTLKIGPRTPTFPFLKKKKIIAFVDPH